MFKGSELNESELYGKAKVHVPDGKYLCMIDSLEDKISKAGNAYYRLGLLIIDGPFKDKLLDIMLFYTSDNENSRRSAMRVMLEMAVAVTGKKDINSADDVLNKTICVTTKLLTGGKEPFLVINKVEPATAFVQGAAPLAPFNEFNSADIPFGL